MPALHTTEGPMKLRVLMFAILTTAFGGTGMAAPGSLDLNFGNGGLTTIAIDLAPSGSDSVRAVLPAAGGRFYLVGSASGPFEKIAITRRFADATVDASYGGGLVLFGLVGRPARVQAGALQADGSLLLAGSTTSKAVTPTGIEHLLCRLDPSGAPDISFGKAGCVQFNDGYALGLSSIRVQKDGRILVAGTDSNPIADAATPYIQRFTAQGKVDGTFNGGLLGPFVVADLGDDARSADISIAPDEKIVLAGTRCSWNMPTCDFFVLRLTPEGWPDASFGNTPQRPGATEIIFSADGKRIDTTAAAVHVLANGSVLVAGTAEISENSHQFAIAKLNSKGQFDGVTFSGSGKRIHYPCDVCVDAHLKAMAVQSDGRIILAGSTEAVPGTTAFVAMRLGMNGAIDTSFGALGTSLVWFPAANVPAGMETNSEATAAALLSNGRLLLAGQAVTNAMNPDNLDFAVTRLFAQ